MIKKSQKNNESKKPITYSLLENNYKLILRKLSKNEYTLFENQDFVIDLSKEYEKFINSPYYREVITENNMHAKKQLTKLFIYESIFRSILKTKNILEETSELNITNEILLETTLEALDKQFCQDFKINRDVFITLIEETSLGDDVKKLGKLILDFGIWAKDMTKGLVVLVILILKSFAIISGYVITGALKFIVIDLLGFAQNMRTFKDIVTIKNSDGILNKFIDENVGINFAKILEECWSNVYKKHRYLKKSESKIFRKSSDILYKINSFFKKLTSMSGFRASLNNPFYYNAIYLIDNLFFNDYEYMGIETNICAIKKLKEIAESVAEALFEYADVSGSLLRNITRSRNNMGKIRTSFRDLYMSHSNDLSKDDKIFVNIVLFLIDLKNVVDEALKRKNKMSYRFANEYEMLSKEIIQSFKNIEEMFERTKNFNPQKIGKKEENLKQNNKPKKEDLFDL